jgi:formylglycine-generating enzyme required for sulfatase activity
LSKPAYRLIEPVPFRVGGRRRSRQGGGIGTVLAGILAAVLVAAAWYVFTAGRVEFVVTPEPAYTIVEGGAVRPKIGGRYLLRPGEYRVTAGQTGYQELVETVAVGRNTTRIELTLSKLPGIIAIECVDATDPATALTEAAIKIDGDLHGQTPIEPTKVSAGTHRVTAVHPRYKATGVDVEVVGMEKKQTVVINMPRAWAPVAFSSEPAGDLIINGEEGRRTPSTIELAEGTHQITVRAVGFKPKSRSVTVEGGGLITLDTLVLEPVDAEFRVESTPSGAQVIIDGNYIGETPVTTSVKPGVEHTVKLSKIGFLPVSVLETAKTGEKKVVNVDMQPVLGTVILVVEPADAKLWVDGKPYGEVPRKLELSVATHTLRFRREGYFDAEVKVKPREGLEVGVPLKMKPIVAEEAVVEPGKDAATGAPKSLTAGNGMRLLRIDSSDVFSMGTTRREPGRRANETLRKVRLERPFYIAEELVTNDQFKEFTRDHKPTHDARISLTGPDQPVVSVSWEQAAEFCNWLSKRDGLPPAYEATGDGGMKAIVPPTAGYRMPTEAEWSYCARTGTAGTTLRFPWGEKFPPLEKTGNYADISAKKVTKRTLEGYNDGFAATSPVGSFDANHLGLYDMGGNAAEWCHDLYSIYTFSATRVDVDPMGPESGGHHVIRGSGWRHASITALRLTYRDYHAESRDDVGFRICRYAPTKK